MGVTATLASAEPLSKHENAQTQSQADRVADFVLEASKRFAIPERWIRTVMQVESGNNPKAVSPKGAMGLMQIMPDTWAELRARYSLGADPFDPHDSILAGAAYLREMHDRYGTAGFLAAYNAGPARYDEHLATGRPLPDETIAYVTALNLLLKLDATYGSLTAGAHTVSWRQAPLFVQKPSARDDVQISRKPPSKVGSIAGDSTLAPQSEGLFVHRERRD